jgi:ethanolamine utilization cobalamin adenosyltransferase
MFDSVYVIKYADNRDVAIVNKIFTDDQEAQNYATALFDDDYIVVELSAKDLLLAMNGLY